MIIETNQLETEEFMDSKMEDARSILHQHFPNKPFYPDVEKTILHAMFDFYVKELIHQKINKNEVYSSR